MTTTDTIPRPLLALRAMAKRYPQAWRMLDEFRAGRGRDGLPAWPEWCHVPLAGAYAVVSSARSDDTIPFEAVGDVGRLGALAAWRIGQGIYRVDPALYAALIDTPIDGDLPCDVLYHLPEWCVYVETPDLAWLGERAHGFWAHLEWDANCGRSELRLLLDLDRRTLPMPVHLGPWSLVEAMRRTFSEASRQSGTHGMALPYVQHEDIDAGLALALGPFLSLLLYLCSTAAEIGTGERRPIARPTPKQTKHGPRYFPPDTPTTWDVGVRIGAALRAAYHREQLGQDSAPSGGRVRPHVRRAHWHTYLLGPRDDPAGQRRELRWIPPIGIGIADSDQDDLPAVIHPVSPPPESGAGNGQISTAQSQFGGASGLFDGAGDLVSSADGADWPLGWTIECWVRPAEAHNQPPPSGAATIHGPDRRGRERPEKRK